MLEMNYFIYAIFPLSDLVLLNFVSADSRITSGRNQKFVSLLLISSSSRPNLLCFGFDLNQSLPDSLRLGFCFASCARNFTTAHPMTT